MMKLTPILLLAIVLLSCSDRRSKLKIENANAFLDVSTGRKSEERSEIIEQAADSNHPIERKLIKNGRMSFRTKEIKKTKEEVEKVCKELNAYISYETQNNYENGLSFSQKIRVPSTRFEELIGKIEALADYVDNKNIDTQDVTEEFIDVESRLKTKKELEKRYTVLLDRAHTVEELLSIEKEMGNVRAEIESMEGRLNYLKNQIAFSTLDLNYYEESRGDFGFASRFVKSMREGWNNLLSFIIALMSLWPFIIVLLTGTWVFFRYRRKKKLE